jgi:hypothetical protein
VITIEIEHPEGAIDAEAMQIVRSKLEAAGVRIRNWKPGAHLLAAVVFDRAIEKLQLARDIANPEAADDNEDNSNPPDGWWVQAINDRQRLLWDNDLDLAKSLDALRGRVHALEDRPVVAVDPARRTVGEAQNWRTLRDLVRELDTRSDGPPYMGDDDVLDVIARTLRRAAMFATSEFEPVALVGDDPDPVADGLRRQLEDARVRAESAEHVCDEVLDKLAILAGCATWDYPGQIVRDVANMRTALLDVRRYHFGLPPDVAKRIDAMGLDRPELVALADARGLGAMLAFRLGPKPTTDPTDQEPTS